MHHALTRLDASADLRGGDALREMVEAYDLQQTTANRPDNA